MHKQEKLNSLIREKLAHIVNQELELPDILITLIQVKADPDLNEIQITFSILPENRVITSLKALKKKSKLISEKLQKQANLSIVPRLKWALDSGEKKAKDLEKILQEINDY